MTLPLSGSSLPSRVPAALLVPLLLLASRALEAALLSPSPPLPSRGSTYLLGTSGSSSNVCYLEQSGCKYRVTVLPSSCAHANDQPWGEGEEEEGEEGRIFTEESAGGGGREGLFLKSTSLLFLVKYCALMKVAVVCAFIPGTRLH